MTTILKGNSSIPLTTTGGVFTGAISNVSSGSSLTISCKSELAGIVQIKQSPEGNNWIYVRRRYIKSGDIELFC